MPTLRGFVERIAVTLPLVFDQLLQANDFILFGKSSGIASNRRSDQEMTMLALHLMQNSLVYINTLMLQQVLAQDSWQNRLTKEDWRGLTALFYLHINPYGKISLDMTTRLGIEETVTM